ncbi:hypothetical protein ASD65_16090 [Microbacterium sp. Root61]|uniref:hypothetical protein n=1 Tax=Microbacterium sp. Root61 TaxID=1736570 RepID=UPI0006F51635|nr:hypothetical protein [Microbacterium sp. Root61]KRA25774.1 hypothetical protein ASD65_16090 [Microbacterium sp. Root61]
MAAVSSGAAPKAYTCSGGDIPSGTYASVAVNGPCTVSTDAVITVLGSVNVAAGAMLDAQSAPSTVTISGNVNGARGSFLGLGCQPPSYTGNSAHECAQQPEGHSTISVMGNVSVTGAVAVMLNGVTIRGNVTLSGGGSDIPWSIKNNTLTGNLTISGQRTEWLGALFNTIGGNAKLTDIALSDSHPGAPGVYIVRNTVRGNLICTGLTPGVSGGFVPGSVNVVGGNATGQCAALI